MRDKIERRSNNSKRGTAMREDVLRNRLGLWSMSWCSRVGQLRTAALGVAGDTVGLEASRRESSLSAVDLPWRGAASL